jgi:predicted RNA-binding protein YlxR (DUF448 family)
MAERTCISTGNTLPRDKLIRFVAGPSGYAVVDLAEKLPGRGAWITSDAALLRQADKKGHFKRSLGVGLESIEDDITLIAKLMRDRCLALAGMARRAGMLLGGSGKLLAEGPFDGLLAAKDASERECKRLQSKLDVEWVSKLFTAEELGQVCGRDAIAFVGVRATRGHGSENILANLYDEIERLDGFYTSAGCNDLPDGCIT